MTNYIITKLKNKYHIYDVYKDEMLGAFDQNKDIRYRITKSKKVYIISSWEIIDDYYCDTGAITHYEEHKEYIGTLIFGSDNIQEIAEKYSELKKGNDK